MLKLPIQLHRKFCIYKEGTTADSWKINQVLDRIPISMLPLRKPSRSSVM